MPFAKARVAADRLCAWLQPFTERIEVAGSVRRCRPQCHDIDLVAIPKWDAIQDLAGETELFNLLKREVRRRCDLEKWEVTKDGPESLAFTAKGFAVDLYYADARTFGSRLLCRTGSEAHNVWLAKRARSLDGKWESLTGVRVAGRLVQGSEEELYAALKLPWISPELREVEYMIRQFGPL